MLPGERPEDSSGHEVSSSRRSFRVRRGAVVVACCCSRSASRSRWQFRPTACARYHRQHRRDRALRTTPRSPPRASPNVQPSTCTGTRSFPVLKALQQAHQNGPQRPLPLPKAMSLSAMERPHALQSSIRFSFRFDLLTKKLETAGQPISAATRAWLPDTSDSAHAHDLRHRRGIRVTILGQPGGSGTTSRTPCCATRRVCCEPRLASTSTLASLRPVISSGDREVARCRAPLTGGVQRLDGARSSSPTVTASSSYSLRGAVHLAVHGSRHPRYRHGRPVRADPRCAPRSRITSSSAALPKSRLPLILVLLAVTAASHRHGARPAARVNRSSRGCAATSSPACHTSYARRSRRSGCSPRR